MCCDCCCCCYTLQHKTETRSRKPKHTLKLVYSFVNNSARFAEDLLHITVILVIPIPAHCGWLRWWQDLSPPPRSGGSGGRRIATWLNILRGSHRVWEVLRTSWYGTMDIFCSSMSREVPQQAMWSVRSRRAGTKGESPRWVGSLRFGPVRVGELVELLNRVCQWDGGVPMTVAHYRERVGVKWIMPLKVWGLYFQLVFKCWCCFAPRKDGTLCFIIVNFVVICIHRGLPSQTHHCWFSADENGTSGISLQSKSYISKRGRFAKGIGLFIDLKTYNLYDFKWPKSSSTLFSRTTVWFNQPQPENMIILVKTCVWCENAGVVNKVISCLITFRGSAVMTCVTKLSVRFCAFFSFHLCFRSFCCNCRKPVGYRCREAASRNGGSVWKFRQSPPPLRREHENSGSWLAAWPVTHSGSVNSRFCCWVCDVKY